MLPPPPGAGEAPRPALPAAMPAAILAPGVEGEGARCLPNGSVCGSRGSPPTRPGPPGPRRAVGAPPASSRAPRPRPSRPRVATTARRPAGRVRKEEPARRPRRGCAYLARRLRPGSGLGLRLLRPPRRAPLARWQPRRPGPRPLSFSSTLSAGKRKRKPPRGGPGPSARGAPSAGPEPEAGAPGLRAARRRPSGWSPARRGPGPPHNRLLAPRVGLWPEKVGSGPAAESQPRRGPGSRPWAAWFPQGMRPGPSAKRCTITCNSLGQALLSPGPAVWVKWGTPPLTGNTGTASLRFGPPGLNGAHQYPEFRDSRVQPLGSVISEIFTALALVSSPIG